MTELFVFESIGASWLPHHNKMGTGLCYGRIFRLFYPYKWESIYCKRPCCGISDEEAHMDNPEARAGDPRIVATRDNFTHTDFYFCVDCGRVGIQKLTLPTKDNSTSPREVAQDTSPGEVAKKE